MALNPNILNDELFDKVSESINLQKPKRPKLRGVVDVIFLIDVSGSMGPAIDELTANIEKFIENLDENLIKEARIKIGSYSDLEVDEMRYALNLDRPFRDKNDIENLRKDLQECRNIVELGLGGDEPESALDAIYRAIGEFKEEWSKRRRVIILFTDAHTKPIHSSTVEGLNPDEAFEQLKKNILKEHVDIYIYAPLDRNFERLAREASKRVIYNAINEDGTSPVRALRNLDFSAVLETLGKSVSQPSEL